ncbi:MAG: enoyl-CoA hydratase-related protein [Chloroflexota bacterium]
MSLVLVTQAGPVATLTLNRPERHNSLVPEFLRDLLDAIEQVATAPDVRAVVLQANGSSFSTGGDAGGFVRHSDDIAAYAQEIVGLLNDAILALIDLPVPLVACVQGPLTGGALGLVLAADMMLVASEASFTPYYSVIGPSPDGGWTAMLPAVIGRNRAAAVLMLNETISAEQAVEWGMAYQVIPGDSIRNEAQRLARTLAGRKPGSIRHTRQLLNANRDRIAEALAAELEHFVEHIVTDEAAGGFATFVANLRSMKGLHEGQRTSLTRTFTQADLTEYRELSGDDGLGFGRSYDPETVPGPLIAGLFSTLLGTDLPGRGTNWLKQTLAFSRPAYVNEPVIATVEITRLRPENTLVNLRTVCRNPSGDLICEGDALVMVRDRAVQSSPLGKPSPNRHAEVPMA